jgi:hypothetical protein
VVLHASGPGYKRRDAEAVQHVARRLSFKDSPATDFRPLPVGEKGWQEFTTTEPVEAICVVGRLGLLGQEAVAVLENREARFRFVQQERAKGVLTDTVRQSYHIHEYVDGRNVNEYRPLDRPGGRTDYGIVQLYRKFVGTRHVTVLLCAGCSSLGTMGAALWLARDLGRPTDTADGRTPIPQPPSLGPHPTMEALVRSVCVPNSRIWRPAKIDLLGLYVDHYQWSNSEMKWLDIQPHVIELQMQQGKPTLLKIDGTPAGFQPESQNFRLAVRVVQQAHENNGVVDTVALANDVWIWGKSIDPSLVKQKLHRFSLTKLISFGHEIRLNAQVRIIQA